MTIALSALPFDQSLSYPLERLHNIPISNEEWFSDGIDCEVLKIGSKGWQKGKVKINLQVSLEFCPDEPEIEETPDFLAQYP